MDAFSSDDESNNRPNEDSNTGNLPNFPNKLIYSLGARVLVSPSLTAAKKGHGDVGWVSKWDHAGKIDIRWETGGPLSKGIDPTTGLVQPAMMDTTIRQRQGQEANGPGLLSNRRAEFRKKGNLLETQQPTSTPEQTKTAKQLLPIIAASKKWSESSGVPHPLVDILAKGKKKRIGWVRDMTLQPKNKTEKKKSHR